MYKSTKNLEFDTYLDYEGRTICRCEFLEELHRDMAATAMYWPIANALSVSVGMTHFEKGVIDWSALEEWAREEAPYLMEEDEEDPGWENLSSPEGYEEIPAKYMPPEAKYRWKSPAFWLLDKLKEWDTRDLALAADDLAVKLDPEDIYDIWKPVLWEGVTDEFDWLKRYIWGARQANDNEELQRIIKELIGHLGNDPIQDLFEREMDRDGYFIPIIKCNCGKE